MIVANVVDGQLRVLDRLREMVRLAAGLGAGNRLSADAQERGLACLAKFGQRLRNLPAHHIRIVGTNTLRQARNGAEFLERAEKALGYEVEVVSGIEEARLIYLGVSHSASPAGKRLVIDIGGGSTELILGSGFEPQHLESLFMGCVSMSRRFFADGTVSKQAMQSAELAARLELEPVRWEFTPDIWDVCTGASGTIKSIQEVIRARGWGDQGITPKALKRLCAAMIEAGHAHALPDKIGVSEERADVFPGGVAVLSAVVKGLGIERMDVSEWALREGLIFDLQGRTRDEDVRSRTVADLERRHSLDTVHGEEVASTALTAFDAVQKPWQLRPSDDRPFLEWAAHLHELGLTVSHSQYHKHGAYLLENADLAGFSHGEQRLLAVLVRGHRRKFPAEAFETIPRKARTGAERLCVLLRLAVLLNRGRDRGPKPLIRISARDNRLTLEFAEDWLETHPLTVADLQQEAGYLDAAGYRLEF
jgi:exopolyphosphatase/guanosine-5'-triphosphate,3'-diphosphate pyrophosphatase